MTNTENTTTVVGLFDTVAQAQNAVQRLTERGISRDQISLVARNEEGKGTVTTRGDKTSADGTSLGENVAGGALFGGLGGLLIGLGALAIPGIGPVVAAGPLAAALAGTGIGALGGGVIGGLKQAGVPDTDADLYAESVRRGGTLVTVTTSEPQAQDVSTILNDAGAVDIDERASEYRNSGWNKFDANAEPYPIQRSTQYGDRDLDRAEDLTASPDIKTGGKAKRDLRTGETQSIPVVEEQMNVDKRSVPKGTVRVYNTVSERPVEEQVRLREETVRVDRHPVDRAADPGDIDRFREGSIEMTEMREEPVVSKRARVVEEVTLGKDVTERTETVRDTVRRTDVKVDNAAGVNTQRNFDTFDRDFRTDYQSNYANSGMTYDDYMPAYRYGYDAAGRYSGRDYASVEQDLRRDYERSYPGSAWDRVKNAVRYGWDKVTGKTTR